MALLSAIIPPPHSNNCANLAPWHPLTFRPITWGWQWKKISPYFSSHSNMMMIISVVSDLGSEWVVDRSQRVVVTFTLDAGTATKMMPWSQLEEKTTLPCHYLGQYFDPGMPLTWYFLRCFGELAPILAFWRHFACRRQRRERNQHQMAHSLGVLE